MKNTLLVGLLAAGFLFGATNANADHPSLDEIRLIEQEYARQHNGSMIPDNQLEYYLERWDAGWTLSQIGQDMASYRRTNRDSAWRPQSGYVMREVVCTSIDNRYRECPIPFRGTAVITQQLSRSACVEGQSWGQKAGSVWVNRGCRARFGVVSNNNNANRTVVCNSNKGRYRECPTGLRGPVRLLSRLQNSSACIEGRTWGQRPGLVWVKTGCRAQFVAARVNTPRPMPIPPRPGDFNDEYSVICGSTSGNPVKCDWDDRYGEPKLDRQLSSAACIEGRSWDYDGSHDIWVSEGCRGRFVSTRDSFGQSGSHSGHDHDDEGDYSGGWNRDSNYSVTCSSIDGRRSICAWDNRYGQPRLIQQMSQTACVEGRDWGYDSRGGLWVDAGCRARFGFR